MSTPEAAAAADRFVDRHLSELREAIRRGLTREGDGLLVVSVKETGRPCVWMTPEAIRKARPQLFTQRSRERLLEALRRREPGQAVIALYDEAPQGGAAFTCYTIQV